MNVIERIEEQINNLVEMVGGQTSKIQKVHVAFEDLIDLMLLVKQNQQTPWVSVGDRLPENNVGKYKVVEPTVVLCTDGKSIYKAYYVKKHEINSADMNYEGDLDCNEEDGEEYWPEGWYECSSENEDTDWSLGAIITHWMLLPAPPK